MITELLIEKLYNDLHNWYINKRVKIKDTWKAKYISQNLVGKYGTIVKVYSNNGFGVLVDNKYNDDSEYGVYWFDKDELEFLESESEDTEMKEFKYVATVNLLDDCKNEHYAFALYDEDFNFIKELKHDEVVLVVVNTIDKNNRVLGTIESIMSAEDFYNIDKNKEIKITAEVVGVVNMDRYITREEEKIRLKELKKKKAAIEKELEEEINKRKSIEYYEAMANRYSDNPKLAELVEELRSIETF